jgi:hypothetical protein
MPRPTFHNTSGVNIVPRHIVCLTFDFDTQCGFVSRALAS